MSFELKVKKANCVKSEEVDVIKRKERELIGKKKLLSSCNKNKCFAFYEDEFFAVSKVEC